MHHSVIIHIMNRMERQCTRWYHIKLESTNIGQSFWNSFLFTFQEVVIKQAFYVCFCSPLPFSDVCKKYLVCILYIAFEKLKYRKRGRRMLMNDAESE